MSRRLDRSDRFAVQSWQCLDLDAYGLTAHDTALAVQFVTADGTVYTGHRAIAEALRHCAPGWRPFGRALTLPGVDAVAARAYAWVAGHRHQLPGGTAACAVKPS
jgi:predicted DCC family thiol-disulfide oxidoreductase YuxK